MRTSSRSLVWNGAKAESKRRVTWSSAAPGRIIIATTSTLRTLQRQASEANKVGVGGGDEGGEGKEDGEGMVG
jgi:hypothetical protein